MYASRGAQEGEQEQPTQYAAFKYNTSLVQYFASAEERADALRVIRRRLKVLALVSVAFLAYCASRGRRVTRRS